MGNAIITSYNNLEIMTASIEALLLDGISVVVVDNASDDGSAGYLKAERRVRTIQHDTNLGSAAARNAGIRCCPGRVLLLDSDILYIRGSYACLEALLEHFQVDCVGFDPFCCTSVREDVWSGFPGSKIAVQPGWIAYTQYGLFSERVFEKCTFDETYGPGWGLEDDDLFLQMSAHNMKTMQVRWRYFHRQCSSITNLLARGASINYVQRSAYFEQKWGRAYCPGLKDAKKELTDRQVKVFELHGVANLPLAQTGELLGIPPGEVEADWEVVAKWVQRQRPETDRLYDPWRLRDEATG